MEILSTLGAATIIPYAVEREMDRMFDNGAPLEEVLDYLDRECDRLFSETERGKKREKNPL